MDIVSIICIVIIMLGVYEINKKQEKKAADSKDILAQLYLIQCELKTIRQLLQKNKD